MTIYDILRLVGKAFYQTMTPTNIYKSNFKVTSIYPSGKNNFTSHEFFSSEVTDHSLNINKDSTENECTATYSAALASLTRNAAWSQPDLLMPKEKKRQEKTWEGKSPHWYSWLIKSCTISQHEKEQIIQSDSPHHPPPKKNKTIRQLDEGLLHR